MKRESTSSFCSPARAASARPKETVRPLCRVLEDQGDDGLAGLARRASAFGGVADPAEAVVAHRRALRPDAEAFSASRLALLPASTVPTASKIVDLPAPVGPTSAAAPRIRICSRRMRYQLERAMSVRRYTVRRGRGWFERSAQLAGLGRRRKRGTSPRRPSRQSIGLSGLAPRKMRTRSRTQ